MQLPTWWIYASGIMCVTSLLLNVVLIIAVAAIVPKILAVLNDLKGQIHAVTEKVNTIATTAQNTVSTVHTRTNQILGSTEEASAEVTRRISTAGAALTALFVVTRLVGAMRGATGHTPKTKR